MQEGAGCRRWTQLTGGSPGLCEPLVVGLSVVLGPGALSRFPGVRMLSGMPTAIGTVGLSAGSQHSGHTPPTRVCAKRPCKPRVPSELLIAGCGLSRVSTVLFSAIGKPFGYPGGPGEARCG